MLYIKNIKIICSYECKYCTILRWKSKEKLLHKIYFFGGGGASFRKPYAELNLAKPHVK